LFVLVLVLVLNFHRWFDLLRSDLTRLATVPTSFDFLRSNLSRLATVPTRTKPAPGPAGISTHLSVPIAI
jgi:hypothetical protein